MRKWIILAVFLLFLSIFVWVNNNWLQTTEYTISSTELPEAFDGMRIVQVADLHNAVFGERQERLVSKIEAAEPDAIFLTGDLVDSNRYNLEAALLLIDQIVELGDVYFVTGNHEIASNKSEKIIAELEERGVITLLDETYRWERNGESIHIAGINDPLLDATVSPEEFTEKALDAASFSERFTLLLAHRPELLTSYAEAGADVVFSGHAHGGQVRLPGLGGLIAPGQGWFPELTEGIAESGSTRLVISRGLGNSEFPVRIFNRPQIVVVTLVRQ